MVRLDILEGLRQAVSKGEPLRKAMMSFYNAGYPKNDIEEAARALNSPQFQTQTPQQTQPQQQPQQQSQKGQTPGQQPQKVQQKTQQGPTQRVSSYGKKPKTMGTVITFVLVFFLLVLVGTLIGVILFKEELSQLLNGIF